MVSLRSHLARALILLVLPAAWWVLVSPVDAQPNDLLEQWLAAQSRFQTWSADAIQTRALQTLSQPLVSTGKVWVAMPDRFRWELGQPPQTIALRQPDYLFLIYPRLKRVEKYPLNGSQPGPWRDALALLEASFPRNRAALDTHFQVLSVTQSNGFGQVFLQPKSSSARKFMTQIEVGFHLTDFTPAWTELKFSDGSRMRNEFTHGVINPPLPDSLFELKLEPGFTVVEPLRP